MFCTVGDQPTLWEALLPDELRRLPEELARVGGAGHRQKAAALGAEVLLVSHAMRMYSSKKVVVSTLVTSRAMPRSRA